MVRAGVNLDKRRRVMQRSMRLGHCICDPRKPCPCDLFREKDVCLCAGERLEVAEGPVRLTQLVESAGCASKIDQAALKRILAELPSIDDPHVLIGMPAGDDAGVFKLTDDTALVQTVDVFSPSVDDPYMFGQVAAANSLSDVYAMGGAPLSALSIIGFPIRTVPDDVMGEILRGGIDKMTEAGVPVVGGHSIKDTEIKAGFAVTGVVNPDRIVTNAGARPGDVLILTKPLGAGIIAFAAQIGRAPDGSVQAATESMTALNKAASEIMLEMGAHACTDVTGFGLAGHLGEMARASGVDVEITWDDLPLLPGVLECAGQGIFSGAVERNRESSGEAIDPCEGVVQGMVDVCLDAQTSGGLLIAVPAASAGDTLRCLHEAGVGAASVIGKVTGEGIGRIRIATRGGRPIPGLALLAEPERATVPAAPAAGECCAKPQEVSAECCSEAAPEPAASAECCADEGPPHANASAGAAQDAFMAFLGVANRPGALDAATKQALAIALSVVTKCEPCTRAHIDKARKMGFTQEEIDEAAWMAIAFGGSPVMMFYNGVKGS
jgi:selenide,water dikinase